MSTRKNRPRPPADFDDNPPLTEAQLRKARPAVEVAPHLVARSVGRPKAEQTKIPTSIRLDKIVIDAMRAAGPGWQTTANEVLGRYFVRGKLPAKAGLKIFRDPKSGQIKRKKTATPEGAGLRKNA